jgi:hypothetical protein
MKNFTKLGIAFLMAMASLAGYAAEHYVYYDGTLSKPSVWAWNDDENCTSAGKNGWPGDLMTKKDGKWYWELPAGKSVPTQIIISEGTEASKIGGKDLPYVDCATYHQDGSTTADPTIPVITASPASGSFFKEGEDIEVTLTATLDATIYYTTDGTDPTTSSAVYTEPLVFTETTTLNVLAVTAAGKTAIQSYMYTKMPNPDDVIGGKNLITNYYKVNPDGKVGSNRTVNVVIDKTLGYRHKATNAMSNWTADDMIAQGVARDVCQAMKGTHERPIVDSYAIYAAYDDENLYLGVQLVYAVWDLYGEGKQPGESKPFNFGGRATWAFDLSPVAQFDGYIDGKGAIWNDGDKPGAKFANGVDAVWIGSTQAGDGTPGFFTPTPDGHASYDGKYCKSPSEVVYGLCDGLLPDISKIYAYKEFNKNPSVLTGNTGFVDVKSEVKADSHTFYEWKFPLSVLGITKEYIEEYGIGVMYIDIYGSSPVGGTPYDPSYFDNVSKSYSMDPSTSKEKEDEDVITYAPARIGKLLKTDIEDVEADLDENAPVEYFNLMGVKISQPAKGEIYIERRGSKVTKKLNY